MPSNQTTASCNKERTTQALVMLAWSRIWSPLVDEETRTQTWCDLELPGDYRQCCSEYWSLFHAGDPQPAVPTLLHAALNREGTGVREDWIRVIGYLGLSWNDKRLAPDQLGAACEIYACTLERDEPVLIATLADRYLLPWCAVAGTILEQMESPLAQLVPVFRQDILSTRA